MMFGSMWKGHLGKTHQIRISRDCLENLMFSCHIPFRAELQIKLRDGPLQLFIFIGDILKNKNLKYQIK